jgi:hypothetical protein
MEPLSNQYDSHIRSIQLSQTDLAQKIDFISEEIERFIILTEGNFVEVKPQITKLAETRKKLVASYNTLGQIHERIEKIKKAIDKKYPYLNLIFDTFGVPLVELMKRKTETEECPKVVNSIIKRIREIGLERTGLFRIPGADEQIKLLKKKFNQSLDEVDISNYNDINVLASLLKL